MLSYKNTYEPIVREYSTSSFNNNEILEFTHKRNVSIISNYSITGIPEEKEVNNESEEELAQRYRSNSRIKWHICVSIAFSWSSAYFSAYGPIYLQQSLISHFKWSAADYSYMVSFTFIAAIFAPILISNLLHKISAFAALILFQLPIIIGQLIFISIIISPEIHSYYPWILYLSRILIGIGVGGCDSLIISILIFWFGEGNDTTLASCLLVSGIEIGILFGRYCMVPLENAVGLGLAYGLAIILALFAIVMLFFARELEKRWLAIPNTPEFVKRHSRILPPINSDQFSGQTFWRAIRALKIEVWLVIINFGFVNGIIDTMYVTFTSPLMDLYNLSQYTTNKLWSMTSIAVISTAIFIGYFMDKVGCFVQFNLFSMLLFLIGFLVLLFGAEFILSYGTGSWFYAVLAVSIITFGILFQPAIFSLKALIAPVKYASFIGSLATSSHWLASCLFSDAVGWMKDEYHSYSYSVLFISIAAFIQLIIGLLIYYISVKKGLEIHKFRWSIIENIKKAEEDKILTPR